MAIRIGAWTLERIGEVASRYRRSTPASVCHEIEMSTLEAARRRGLGAALTARQIQDARERGSSTTSLQSTQMAERVYAAVGFRDLGRFLEFVP